MVAAGCLGSGQAEACLARTAAQNEKGGELVAKGIALLGAAYLLYEAPGLARGFLGFALSHPQEVQEAVAGIAEGMSNASLGSLTGNLARLSATELSTGVRFAAQEGLQLKVSAHVGEEFVDAAGKTYDAMGGGKAFERFGDGSAFFKSITKHVNKSVDGVIIDLQGASKNQVRAIKAFVDTLKDAQKNKVKYLQ